MKLELQEEKKDEALQESTATAEKPEASPRKTSQNSAKNANRKEKKSVREQMIEELEFSTVNMKLNLDAIEITSELPKSHTQEIGLWEETAALKVIKRKIELINETLTRPELLKEKDEIKHRPLLEKWNNSSGEQQKQKQQKILNKMSTTLKDTTHNNTH